MKEIEKMLNIVTSDIHSAELSLSAIMPQEVETPEDPDFAYARLNLYSIMEQGKMALEGALRVAEQSENPRAYEVVGGLIGQMAALNKTLMQLGKDKEDVKTARKGNSSPTAATQASVMNNTAIFVGSGNDINKLIAERLGNK